VNTFTRCGGDDTLVETNVEMQTEMLLMRAAGVFKVSKSLEYQSRYRHLKANTRITINQDF